MHARTTVWTAGGLLAAVTAATLAGCGGHMRSGEAPEVAVVTVAVDSARVARPVLASGVLAGQSEVPLAFKIGGVIARLDPEAGQAVRSGQVIAALDAAEIGAAVAKAQAAADKAERDWERARALYADSVITKTLFDDAGTARDVARSDLRTARFNQRYAAIVAPADGTVLRRLAEPGQTVGAGTPIVVFSGDGHGQVVRAGLADRDVVRVRVGDAATVTFTALPERTWSGRVTRIGAAAAPGAGTYEVEVRLDEPVRIAEGGALASGLVADVSLVPATRMPVWFVPMTALVEGDRDRARVWTLAPDGRPVRRDVRVAYLDGDRAAVSSGLEGVARVVADGAAYLTPESRARERAR